MSDLIKYPKPGEWAPISYLDIQEGDIVRHVNGSQGIGRAYGMALLVTEVKLGVSRTPIAIRARAVTGTAAAVQPPQPQGLVDIEYIEIYIPTKEEAAMTALAERPIVHNESIRWDRLFGKQKSR